MQSLRRFLIALLLMGLLVPFVPAAEKEEDDPARSYNNYSENAVYNLSGDAQVRPVRFQAVYNEELRDVPRSIRRYRLGRAVIVPGGAFLTQGELLCLVQAKDKDLLKEAANLVKGQQITIEGMTVPADAGFKLVVVENILRGGEAATGGKPGERTEVVIYWPGDPKPKVMRQTGEYTLRLPIPKGARDKIEFKVELRKVKAKN